MTNDWRPRLKRFVNLLEWPMAALALAVVPALIVEDAATTPAVQITAEAINWFIWIAFCLELIARTILAERRLAYLRSAWFDIAIVVISPPFLVPTIMEGARSLRALRVLRLLRFVRAFGPATIGLRASRRMLERHKFHYVALVATVAMGLGAVGVFLVERDVNKSITTLGDALWWSIVTTSVGYGDISLVTGEGRVLAVALMLTGIAVVSIFTASIASFFVEGDRKHDVQRLQQAVQELRVRLDRVVELLEREDASVRGRDAIPPHEDGRS